MIKKHQDDHISTSVSVSKVASLTMKYQLPSKCSAAANNTRRSAANLLQAITFIFKGKAANALTIRKDQCLYTPTRTEFNAVYSAVVSLLRIFASKMIAD